MCTVVARTDTTDPKAVHPHRTVVLLDVWGSCQRLVLTWGWTLPELGVLLPMWMPHSAWGAWVLIPRLLPAADRRAWCQVFTL